MYLPLKMKAQLAQFITEAFFIGRLKQSWTEGAVYLDRAPYDLIGQNILH